MIRPVARFGLPLLALATSLTVQASSVSLETRHSSAGPAPAGSLASMGLYYRDTVSALTQVAPTTGYCDADIALFSGVSNQASCAGVNANIAMHIAVEFSLDSDTNGFGMRFGPDFGRGGALFLDGVLMAARNTDMWWGNSFGNPSQHFAALGLNLAAGTHRVDLYGLEGCCDGGQIGQFQLAPTAGWQTFGSNDGLDPARIPVPATLSLAVLGLALIGRKRRAA